MTTERAYIQKSWPYRLAIFFLYSPNMPGVTHVMPGVVNLILPKLCTHLGIPNNRLRLYLQELERLDIITDLQLSRGFATFIIMPPPNLIKKELDK